MKKSKLLLVFSCVGLLGITACDNQAPTTSSNPPAPPVVTTEDITFSDEKLVTDVLLQNNSEEKDVVENPKVKNVNLTPEKESFKKENILSDYYENRGLLVVKNDEGYVGFYSLLHHGWLIKPSFEEGKFSYRVATMPYINYVLELHYRDTYVILDAFGNILDTENRQYSGQKAEYYYNPNASESSEFKHFKMREEDQSFMSTRLINGKPVLMMPFVEKEVKEEIVKDEQGRTVYKKDEEGKTIYSEVGGLPVPETKEVPYTFVTAYFYEYDTDGSVKILMDENGHGFAHGWPEEEEEEEEELPEEIEKLMVGDYFTGSLTDLADYGLPGYYLVRSGDGNNVYTVYNGLGEVKTTFTVQSELSAHPMIQEFGIIGQKMVFQAFEQVANDSDEYDVFIRDEEPSMLDSHSGAKYICESFTINLLTGERKTFESPYLFKGTINPIVGVGNGDFLYEVTLAQVNDETRTLEAARTYVVDKDLVAHDDITGFEFYDAGEYNLKQLQDGKYYNEETKIVYSSTLKPIVHLSAINGVRYLPEHNVFYGRYQGKYGLVDTNGKVAAEFIYDAINIENGIEGRFLARKDNEYYLVGGGVQETHAGFYLYGDAYDEEENPYEDEQIYLEVYGDNGLYLMTHSYSVGDKYYAYHQFFDAQSVKNGSYEPFARMSPDQSTTATIKTYDYTEKGYEYDQVTVNTSHDRCSWYGALLGEYSLISVNNQTNLNYTIEDVPVLDQYGDPKLDDRKNPIINTEVEDNWIYTYTVIAPTNLKLISYDSGIEVLDEYYAAKDIKTAQELNLGLNEVLRREDGRTYVVFTPEEDGPFIFTANPDISFNEYGLAVAEERWLEDPAVIKLFAQLGLDTTLRVDDSGKLALTLLLKESEENAEATPAANAGEEQQGEEQQGEQQQGEEQQGEEQAPEKTYKPEKVDLKELILHKVYNDWNEAQLRQEYSHLAITLEDVTIYELLPVKQEEPAANAGEEQQGEEQQGEEQQGEEQQQGEQQGQEEAEEEEKWVFPASPSEGYEWVKYEADEVEMDKLETRTFLFILNGTEPEEGKEDKSIKFTLEVKADAALAPNQGEEPAPAQQQEAEDEEEEEPWDPAVEFHMIESEEEMFKTQKSRVTSIHIQTNYEKDEDDKQKAVSIEFYFGEDYKGEGEEHEGEWANGMLKAGHSYYLTFTSTKQENTIEVKESHIHKVNSWLMADVIVPSNTGLESGYKFGICQNGEEAIQKETHLNASENTLTKEEVAEFKANLAKEINTKYGVYMAMVTTYKVDEDDPLGPSKVTGQGTIYVVEGLAPEGEIEQYNENRGKNDPEMKEISAETMAENVSAARITQAQLEKFLKAYQEEGDEPIETRWNIVQLRYLYDEDFDVVKKDEEGKPIGVEHTKAFYSIYAEDTDAHARYVAIYNAQGVLIYSSFEEQPIPNTDRYGKVTVVMSALYTEQFAELLLEQYGF